MAAGGQAARSGWFGEAFSRLAQLLVRGHLFDAPGLIALRHFVLRRMFDIDKKVLIGARFYFIRPHGFTSGFLKVGRGTKINHNVEIDYSGGVEIGRDVWISQNVLIETHAHEVGEGPKEEWPTAVSPLRIEDESWIGANVLILPGAKRIGIGAIVGGGAIVTKDVEDWSIVAGAPAKVIGQRKPFNLGDRT